MQQGPIGVFDSGYGGLTVLREILSTLPGYDYLYLGDNARAPYGPRSFDTVHRYTLEAVEWLFREGCPLVILACNTASAKALRTLQQRDLPRIAPDNRVLGVIRPTAEVIGHLTKTGEIGVLGTTGTIRSDSYPMEIGRFFPEVVVHQQDCPMWVPLVEYRAYDNPGADHFIRECLDRLMQRSSNIDTVLLACTHYPVLAPLIRRHLPEGVRLLEQGAIVAERLTDYLHRHPDMRARLAFHPEGGRRRYCTTDETQAFDEKAGLFLGEGVRSEHVALQV
jgi:glutamate racemase